MLHIRMSHVVLLLVSSVAFLMSHMNVSSHTYERVVSHKNTPCHIRMSHWTLDLARGLFVSGVAFCISQMNVWSHTYEWVISRKNVSCHIRMNSVTPQIVSGVAFPMSHIIQSCRTCQWVMSHIWLSHVVHMNESCPIRMSHVTTNQSWFVTTHVITWHDSRTKCPHESWRMLLLDMSHEWVMLLRISHYESWLTCNDMTHSYGAWLIRVGHDSFVWDMTRSYVWHENCHFDSCPLDLAHELLVIRVALHVWSESNMSSESQVIMCHVTYMNESCRTYEWVMSHIWVRHVAHMSEACRTYRWVMSHMYISESCYTYEWIYRRAKYTNASWMSHVPRKDAFMSNTWMSHVTNMNESCQIRMSHVTYEWVK